MSEGLTLFIEPLVLTWVEGFLCLTTNLESLVGIDGLQNHNACISFTHNTLVGYANVGYLFDMDFAKSQIEYVFMVGGITFLWNHPHHNEIIALHEASCKAV